MAKCCKGKQNNSVAASPFIQLVEDAIAKIEAIFDAHPPEQRGEKYGNPAFREFIDDLKSKSADIHSKLLQKYPDAIIEVQEYLFDSFGSYGRLDFGTGHELNFIVWFCCFLRLDLAGTQQDVEGFALRVFPRYLELTLRIENIYTLEPAGSRGAWSMDDYNLLPYYLGAAQLIPTQINVNSASQAFGAGKQKDSTSATATASATVATKSAATSDSKTENTQNNMVTQPASAASVTTADEVENDVIRTPQQALTTTSQQQQNCTISATSTASAASVTSSTSSTPASEHIIGVRDIFNKEIMDQNKNAYMYCRMISNIYEVKSFGLETNSPFISQIHYVPGQTWEKIYEGMKRHYNHEVFEKWPVIQHFWFGNIFPLD